MAPEPEAAGLAAALAGAADGLPAALAPAAADGLGALLTLPAADGLAGLAGGELLAAGAADPQAANSTATTQAGPRPTFRSFFGLGSPNMPRLQPNGFVNSGQSTPATCQTREPK